MNIVAVSAQLESDQKWREDEIRFFQNQGTRLISKDGQNQFRRALILFLYAHFEGFCKFSFQLYIDTINQEGIVCGEATSAIAAASLSDLFRALRNPEKKSDIFRKDLPDDTKLHRFARDREFIEEAANFAQQQVNIPDSIVETLNLTPIVLRKNLFRLGLPHDLFMHLDGYIHRLLNSRNAIAHGGTRTGVSSEEYLPLRDTTFNIMEEVKQSIIEALKEKQYLHDQTDNLVE